MKKKKKKKKNKSARENKINPEFRLAVIRLIALLFLIGFAYLYSQSPMKKENVKLDTTKITVTLSSAPVEKTTRILGKMKKDKYFELYTKEYPSKRFVISGFSYRLCSPTIVDELSKDSMIQIGVLTEDLETKLSDSIKLTFDTTSVRGNIVEVYDVTYVNNVEAKVFLHQENVEHNLSRNKEGIVIYVLLPFVMIFLFCIRNIFN